ncbi:MAG: cobyrinic acid a,c-diamide synthase, partial [Pseudomonadota bacterium]
MKAVLIAAAGSGAGKTTVTLALMRALRNAGHTVRSLKLGPDYIDPGFHRLATGTEAYNLDPWAMPAAQQAALIGDEGPLVIESA